jgi:hypothetical protein
MNQGDSGLVEIAKGRYRFESASGPAAILSVQHVFAGAISADIHSVEGLTGDSKVLPSDFVASLKSSLLKHFRPKSLSIIFDRQVLLAEDYFQRDTPAVI